MAHCGSSLAGDFIWSLTYTDIFSGWTEGRAVWNKGAAGVVAATQDMEGALPFGLLGFDCDNGSEFLNHHLWGYLAQRRAPVEFTRSRPYHKDDNAHVEQKTGCGRVNFWATRAWKTPLWWCGSVRCTKRLGDRCTTSFCPA